MIPKSSVTGVVMTDMMGEEGGGGGVMMVVEERAILKYAVGEGDSPSVRLLGCWDARCELTRGASM